MYRHQIQMQSPWWYYRLKESYHWSARWRDRAEDQMGCMNLHLYPEYHHYHRPHHNHCQYRLHRNPYHLYLPLDSNPDQDNRSVHLHHHQYCCYKFPDSKPNCKGHKGGFHQFRLFHMDRFRLGHNPEFEIRRYQQM